MAACNEAVGRRGGRQQTGPIKEAHAIIEVGDSRTLCGLVGHKMLLVVDLSHLLVEPGTHLWPQLLGRLRHKDRLSPGSWNQSRENCKVSSQKKKKNRTP